MDIEAIEILKKRIDDLEGKANFHKRKMEDCEAEIWRTQLVIDRMKKEQSTITDFKTAKRLQYEKRKDIVEALDPREKELHHEKVVREELEK